MRRVISVPADPAKQDDVTAVVVGYNFARELVEHVEGWVFRTQVPIQLDQRIQISVLLQLREIGVVLFREGSSHLVWRIGTDDYDRSDVKTKDVLQFGLLRMEPLQQLGFQLSEPVQLFRRQLIFGYEVRFAL